MGFRRWLIFLACVIIPLILLAAGLRAVQGPYSFSCRARHDGFAIIYTSETSGGSKAFGIPFGECPARIITGHD